MLHGRRSDMGYTDFVRATVALKSLPLPQVRRMTDAHKLCFFVNLYNALLLHGAVEHGANRCSILERVKFLDG
jgi:hypothetical protein